MELRLGEKQTLVIVKKVEFGVYLATKEAPEDKVLLPAKQVPEGAKVGDELEVFLYRDSSDRLISTTRTPKLCIDRKSTRLNSSHNRESRMPSSA